MESRAVKMVSWGAHSAPPGSLTLADPDGRSDRGQTYTFPTDLFSSQIKQLLVCAVILVFFVINAFKLASRTVAK